jgi:hypothetical protein
VQEVAEEQAAAVAVAPKLATVPSTKPVPVMVTTVPPPSGPPIGVIDVTVGPAS